jgi:hypothetical protein
MFRSVLHYTSVNIISANVNFWEVSANSNRQILFRIQFYSTKIISLKEIKKNTVQPKNFIKGQTEKVKYLKLINIERLWNHSTMFYFL